MTALPVPNALDYELARQLLDAHVIQGPIAAALSRIVHYAERQQGALRKLDSAGQPWMPAEDENLRHELMDMSSWLPIAAAHGRTVGAVQARALKLGCITQAEFDVIRSSVHLQQWSPVNCEKRCTTRPNSAMNEESPPAVPAKVLAAWAPKRRALEIAIWSCLALAIALTALGFLLGESLPSKPNWLGLCICAAILSILASAWLSRWRLAKDPELRAQARATLEARVLSMEEQARNQVS